MHSMMVACVLLFCSFYDPMLQEDLPCALINWFIPVTEDPDQLTGMWVIKPEFLGGKPMLKVIHQENPMLTYYADCLLIFTCLGIKQN